jgi:hypothetical protein
VIESQERQQSANRWTPVADLSLCVGLVAAGKIGVGRQRGIGFAVAGILIGALVPVVVCIGFTMS